LAGADGIQGADGIIGARVGTHASFDIKKMIIKYVQIHMMC